MSEKTSQEDKEPIIKPGMRVHIMGVGGAGMSAIAQLMLEQGFSVTGCDLTPSSLMDALRKESILVEVGHDSGHIATYNVEALVVSSAIPNDHPEIEAAERMGLPVLKRSDVLGILTAGKKTVAVAGTHGKTTTTAMIAHILNEVGQDASYIVGGVMSNTGKNAYAGSGEAFVIEADEYDQMFMGLHPDIVVLTTLEMDHPDMFESIEDVRRLFREFVGLLPETGLLITNHDTHETLRLAKERQVLEHPALTYGITGGVWQADEVRLSAIGKTEFLVKRLGFDVEQVALQIPGDHNVQNALAAIAAAVELGVPLKDACEALNTFSGVGRRFEIKGQPNGVTIIDDYAHHPTAIAATLKAARQRYSAEGDLWAVWQPHTFSRTRALFDQFVSSFDEADHVIVTDIYRSRDVETFNVTPQTILQNMIHRDARYVGDLDNVIEYVGMRARPGDTVVVLSAGTATRVASGLVDWLGTQRETEE